ncbi:acyl-CoA thioesterase [Sphingobium jiangsuense]|uniref:Acyl-CoA thioesterase n=1 Tax=Sphingobium jiangsuense TaxID=870476 RepID=A0A7W6BIV5_9SPHN|nr:hydroxyphenylacetyl-CoA thioesterase PaaI [Sphingobium jiangsuense]MBB3926764.1 acyl-CoA thioesterase [Sphingobium jiangsuense]
MKTPDPDSLARRIADHMLASEGTGPAWGIRIEEARVGYARIGMTLRADMANGHGTAHGGMLFALADTAFAYACNSRNRTSVAASASILFLAPARVGDTIIAEAREEASAGRSGAYSVLIHKADGTAIAQFQGQSRIIGGPIIDIDTQENENG